MPVWACIAFRPRGHLLSRFPYFLSTRPLLKGGEQKGGGEGYAQEKKLYAKQSWETPSWLSLIRLKRT